MVGKIYGFPVLSSKVASCSPTKRKRLRCRSKQCQGELKNKCGLAHDELTTNVVPFSIHVQYESVAATRAFNGDNCLAVCSLGSYLSAAPMPAWVA